MTRAELAKSILEREMLPEEFDQKLREVMSDEEDRRSVRELVCWFSRRYPTAQDRLAYVRLKTRR